MTSRSAAVTATATASLPASAFYRVRLINGSLHVRGVVTVADRHVRLGADDTDTALIGCSLATLRSTLLKRPDAACIVALPYLRFAHASASAECYQAVYYAADAAAASRLRERFAANSYDASGEFVAVLLAMGGVYRRVHWLDDIPRRVLTALRRNKEYDPV